MFNRLTIFNATSVTEGKEGILRAAVHTCAPLFLGLSATQCVCIHRTDRNNFEPSTSLCRI
jgi:hypothetical protein